MVSPLQLRSPILLSILLMLAACGTRSISDSGYYGDYRGAGTHNRLYRGELSEFDVLGIDRQQEITEAEIQNAFNATQHPSIKKGSAILLIQSGAMLPDEPMIDSLGKFYQVGVFTGVPEQSTLGPRETPSPTTSLAKALRLAAAKGGYETILAYWGVLETAQNQLGTKLVSWVPIVGGAIPDETQRMRIRLKLAVVDVRSGRWDIFVPEPIEDKSLSAGYNRVSSDQQQVAVLKEAAYASAAETIAARYDR
jgi:hypothetical protein